MNLLRPLPSSTEMLASGQHSCPVPSPHTSSPGEIARWPVATHTSSRAWLLSFASSPEPKGAPLTFWPTFFSSRAAPVASRGTALDRFLHSCKVAFCHSLPSFALLSFAVLCLAFLLACSVFTCIAFDLLFSFVLCFISFPWGTALDRFLHSCKVAFCHSLPSFALLSFAVLCLAFLLACSVFTCIAFDLLFSFVLCFISFPSTLPLPSPYLQFFPSYPLSSPPPSTHAPTYSPPRPSSSPTAFPTAPPPLPPLLHFPSPPLSFLPSTTIPPCFKGNLPFLLFTDFLILVALAAILPCFALLCYALLSLYFLPSTPSFELFFTF